MIGDLLEAAIYPSLVEFCEEHGYFLDRQGVRSARSGKKVAWEDRHGNTHDLDFVIERGGTERRLGEPIGFIEVAWRRYIKHSRNKAQEIQGAVLPLVETYEHLAPFQGVVLGGIFTDGALTQLRSLGFSILHFEYDTMIRAFAQHGLDIRFAEDTPTAELKAKVDRVEDQLNSAGGLSRVANTLCEFASDDLALFHDDLRRKLLRRVVEVGVIRLFGEAFLFPTIQAAVAALVAVQETTASSTARGYEVFVRYSNGDQVNGRFGDAREVRSFLESFAVHH
jgi:hypothetical protein